MTFFVAERGLRVCNWRSDSCTKVSVTILFLLWGAMHSPPRVSPNHQPASITEEKLVICCYCCVSHTWHSIPEAHISTKTAPLPEAHLNLCSVQRIQHCSDTRTLERLTEVRNCAAPPGKYAWRHISVPTKCVIYLTPNPGDVPFPKCESCLWPFPVSPVLSLSRLVADDSWTSSER